jgi:hypothetical protein
MRKELFRVIAAAVFVCTAIHFADGAEAPATFKVGALTFTRPEKFKWVEITPGMRAAQMKVEGEQGKSAEVVFFNFGGSGGGVDANVDRWLGMFQEGKDKINAKREKVPKDKGAITYVQAEGTYMSGMPGGPKTPQPNSMLQGAIIEAPEGNVFIRMTGPAELVKNSQKDFRAMVESALK